MEILRQKEFVSRSLKFKVGAETTKRNIKFLGDIGKLTGKRAIETGNLLAINKPGAVKNIATDVVTSNKATINRMKTAANNLGNINTPTSTKVKIVTNLVTDLNPKVAAGKHLAEHLLHTTGKTGTDVVKGLAGMATNPVKTVGEKLQGIREGGHGKKIVSGKFIGPGVNKWCLGLAPDTVIGSVGKQFENYKGANNLTSEMNAIVNSKEGRRFARSYDKTVGKVLNPIHNTLNKGLSAGSTALDTIGEKVKGVFKRPRVTTTPMPQLQPIPIAI